MMDIRIDGALPQSSKAASVTPSTPTKDFADVLARVLKTGAGDPVSKVATAVPVPTDAQTNSAKNVVLSPDAADAAAGLISGASDGGAGAELPSTTAQQSQSGRHLGNADTPAITPNALMSATAATDEMADSDDAAADTATPKETPAFGYGEASVPPPEVADNKKFTLITATSGGTFAQIATQAFLMTVPNASPAPASSPAEMPEKSVSLTALAPIEPTGKGDQIPGSVDLAKPQNAVADTALPIQDATESIAEPVGKTAVTGGQAAAPAITPMDPTATLRAIVPAAEQQATPRSALVRNVLDTVTPMTTEHGQTTFQLRPAGLGLIRIDITQNADQSTTVVMRVQNAAVLDALRQEQPSLSHALSQQGFSARDSFSLETLAPATMSHGGTALGANAHSGQQSASHQEDPGQAFARTAIDTTSEAEVDDPDGLAQAAGTVNIFA